MAFLCPGVTILWTYQIHLIHSVRFGLVIPIIAARHKTLITVEVVPLAAADPQIVGDQAIVPAMIAVHLIQAVLMVVPQAIDKMKAERRLVYILIIQAITILILLWAMPSHGQSFYSSQYHKNGRTIQINSKTVAQKKLTVYQKHSNLYKIRREIAHSKKRRNFKQGKTR